MAERRRHKKRIQVVEASPGIGGFRALGSRKSEGSPRKGERNRGRDELGFRCEVYGCGLRRCEGPGGGGRCWRRWRARRTWWGSGGRREAPRSESAVEARLPA